MKLAALIVLAGLAAGCTMEEPIEVAHETDGAVAEAVAGRIAGDPQSCVEMRRIRSSRAIGDDAILYEGTGDTVYLNRPAGGCQSLGMGRSLRTRTISSSLCRGDIVTVFDPVSGTEYGGCGLGDFVPYRRAR
ncbi:MAG TPA: hypothetical protein VN231_14260 [Allosphingosinicella sp.]|nr:hypothetical protein [Allosphingosinicella sp.]